MGAVSPPIASRGLTRTGTGGDRGGDGGVIPGHPRPRCHLEPQPLPNYPSPPSPPPPSAAMACSPPPRIPFDGHVRAAGGPPPDLVLLPARIPEVAMRVRFIIFARPASSSAMASTTPIPSTSMPGPAQSPPTAFKAHRPGTSRIWTHAIPPQSPPAVSCHVLQSLPTSERNGLTSRRPGRVLALARGRERAKTLAKPAAAAKTRPSLPSVQFSKNSNPNILATPPLSTSKTLARRDDCYKDIGTLQGSTIIVNIPNTSSLHWRKNI